MSDNNENKKIGFSELAKLYGISSVEEQAAKEGEQTLEEKSEEKKEETTEPEQLNDSKDESVQQETSPAEIGEIAITTEGISETDTPDQATENDADPPPKKKKPPSVWKELGVLLIKIILVLLAIAVFFTFFYGVHRVEDNAMNPMVREGDLVIFDRRNRNFRNGDLVAFEIDGVRQIRRVVAQPGDTVTIGTRGLIVNGSLIQEHDIFFDTTEFEGGIEFPYTVRPGHIFVLGDSRSDGRVSVTDSRIYGGVYIETALGNVMTIIRRRKF